MPETFTTAIKWLHLSDLHFRTSQAWSQDVVLRTLLEDVRARYSGSNSPDLIFITGDIAYSGLADEYVLAEEFIKKLLDVTSLGSERLFLVPGNHDIDRGRAEDVLYGVHQRLRDPLEVDRFFASEERRRLLFLRQEAYRTFANRISPPDNGGYTNSSYAHSKQVVTGPITVRVLLLDSSWLSEGGPAERGTLLVGERQVIDSDTPTKVHALKFAILHHPFSWLRDFEQVQIENLLIERVHVVLRGHVHSEDQRTVEFQGNRTTIFTAGASFETRTADNSYGWGSINLATGQGTTVIHKYQQVSHRWGPLAPYNWDVLTGGIPTMSFQESFATISSGATDYPFYSASLLADHETSVPQIMEGEVVFMNLAVEQPGSSNPIGKIVRELRHHLYWKQAWSVHEWSAQCDSLTRNLKSGLQAMAARSRDVKHALDEHERQCRRSGKVILHSFKTDNRTPIIDELRALLDSKNWGKMLEVIGHWHSGGLLSPEESKESSRMEVEALLGLGRMSEALEKVEGLVSLGSKDSEVLSLAAACYYQAKDYGSAASYLHKALDGGIDIERVKSLALAIAGKAGDRRLVERVSAR